MKKAKSKAQVHRRKKTPVIKRGNMCHVLFLDWKRAFDVIPRKRLLEKMREYGYS
jgi:hypothetical protein